MNLEGLKILYVEDEKDAREQLSEILQMFGAVVVEGQNGEEGLMLFGSEHPDMVITDINMPVMDGISMSKAIRELNKHIPILMTTAFSETDYLVRSIETGVNGYLIKPIKKEQLVQKVGHLAMMVQEHKEAELYRKEQIAKQLALAKESTITKLTNLFPSLAIVLDGKKIVFANSVFYELFDEECLKALIDGDKCLDTLILPHKGGVSSFKELKTDTKPAQTVKLLTKKGAKVFQAIKKEEQLTDSNSINTVLMLQDITYQEYQRLKINHYNLFLQEKMLDISREHRSLTLPRKSTSHMQAEPQSSVLQEHKEEKPKDTTQSTQDTTPKQKHELNIHEQAILRRNFVSKLSAVEFCEHVDGEMLDNVKEIMERGESMREHLDEFLATKNSAIWSEVAQECASISGVINQLYEFVDIAYSYQNLSNLLESTNVAALDDKKLKSIKVYLFGMLEDMDSWVQTIFVEKSAIDVHYLDASLFSTMLQLEMSLKDTKKDEDEEDLVLF